MLCVYKDVIMKLNSSFLYKFVQFFGDYIPDADVIHDFLFQGDFRTFIGSSKQNRGDSRISGFV